MSRSGSVATRKLIPKGNTVGKKGELFVIWVDSNLSKGKRMHESIGKLLRPE